MKNGYARNFLIPKGYAALVTADAMRRTEKDKELEAIRQAEEARYRAELTEKKNLVDQLRRLGAHGPITLLYAAKDQEHNSAAILKDVLERD